MNKSLRIGIYGGTFDPIHIAHLRLALEVCSRLSLTQVRIIPCAKPPHRLRPFFSAEQRFKMAQLACQDLPFLMVDDCELKRNRPSWTIDTVRYFRERQADDALFLLLGGDSFAYLNSWKDWQKLLDFAHLVVIKRPHVIYPPKIQEYLAEHQTSINNLQNLKHGKIIVFDDVPLLDISSSQIRSYLEQQKSINFLVPNEVLNFIHQQELFYIP